MAHRRTPPEEMTRAAAVQAGEVTYHGSYAIAAGAIEVFYGGDKKGRQFGTVALETLARALLRELVEEALVRREKKLH